VYELKNPVVQKNKTIEHSASELVGCCEPAASSGREVPGCRGIARTGRGEGGQIEKVLQGRRWSDGEGGEKGVRNIEKVAGS